MTAQSRSAPSVVLVYGVLGIIPFWSAPAASLVAPGLVALSRTIEAGYAALILSFLGGARWGLAVREAEPDPVVVGLAMTPTLAGLAILVLLSGQARLLALAAALALSWAWDVSARSLPPWYPRLRSGLTLGAVGGLCIAALQAKP